jgi:hypothetical protein
VKVGRTISAVKSLPPASAGGIRDAVEVCSSGGVLSPSADADGTDLNAVAKSEKLEGRI